MKHLHHHLMLATALAAGMIAAAPLAVGAAHAEDKPCLLYTSDAADE